MTGLQVLAVDAESVEFSTDKCSVPLRATVADLDRARVRIVRSVSGRTALGGHRIDESDLIELHNAIRRQAASHVR